MYIPGCSWQIPVHYKRKKIPKPIRLPLNLLLSISGLIVKFIRFSMRQRKNHEGGSFIFSAGGDSAEQGVSIGGLGAGTIGRTYRGNFGRWQLYPGKRNNKTVFADQFHIRIKAPGRKYCAVLSPDKPEKGLESWNWGMKDIKAVYYALYPRAWTVYKIPGFELDINCAQITPFIPDNYKESSYPCGVFLWELTSHEKEDIELSLMLTWENNDGAGVEKSGGHENLASSISKKGRKVRGVTLKQNTAGTAKGPAAFFIGAEENRSVSISLLDRFDTGSDGNSVLKDFNKNGRLTDSHKARPSLKGETIGAAVCASFRIPAGKTVSVPFVIAWDIPLTAFGSGRQWYRRYTKFFGKDGKNILKIALEAFEKYREWEKAIDGFQKPVIENKIIPAWLKTALLNELYYLADGGTFWDNGEVNPDKTSLVKYELGDIRHFGYLECFDYDMVNTFDVHFYSSFALAQTFPMLQKSLIRDFAKSVLAEDAEMRPTVLDKKPVMRKPAGVCPHDLGSPRFDPYFKINHYDFHDSSYWKDLNTKFVIQVYYEILREPKDAAFLKTCWPAVEASLRHMEQFDFDSDGIPENTGYPDQTYDSWTMKGLSSYCGGLWVTANAAAARMAGMIKDKTKARFYSERTEKAKEAFEKKLFNGKYYLFDSVPSNRNIIFADQLCGEFWARVLGLSEARLNPGHVKSSLKTIYEYNVKKFGKGKLGAVNGMLISGKIDNRNMQSREAWTGTSYALAALMMTEGMYGEAYQTAQGVYDTTYNYGYAFRTPEAWDRHRNYRATQYMRPLAVWAIWDVLFNKRLKNKIR